MNRADVMVFARYFKSKTFDGYTNIFSAKELNDDLCAFLESKEVTLNEK